MTQETATDNFADLLRVISKPNRKKDRGDKDSIPESKLKDDWDTEKHRLLKKRYSNDTLARLILACSTQTIIVGWLVCVMIILIGNAHRSLSDSVLITLLTTTTTTVIGLALIVLRGFFQYMKQDVELND